MVNNLRNRRCASPCNLGSSFFKSHGASGCVDRVGRKNGPTYQGKSEEYVKMSWESVSGCSKLGLNLLVGFIPSFYNLHHQIDNFLVGEVNRL